MNFSYSLNLISSFILFILNYNNFVDAFRLTIQAKHSRNEICFYKKIAESETINLSYVISGGHHFDKCNVYLYDSENKIIYEHYDDTTGKFENYEIKITGIYRLCFKPLTDSKMYLNLDFHTLSELGLSRTIAKDSKIKINELYILKYNLDELRDMSKYISIVGETLETLYNNLRHLRLRRTTHSLAISSLLENLKLLTIFKAILIILISILQIYLIRKIFLKNVTKVNRPIEITNSVSNDGNFKYSNIYL